MPRMPTWRGSPKVAPASLAGWANDREPLDEEESRLNEVPERAASQRRLELLGQPPSAGWPFSVLNPNPPTQQT